MYVLTSCVHRHHKSNTQSIEGIDRITAYYLDLITCASKPTAQCHGIHIIIFESSGMRYCIMVLLDLLRSYQNDQTRLQKYKYETQSNHRGAAADTYRLI